MPKPDTLRLFEKYKREVNRYFRLEHSVSFYANQLNYRPKSLSNKFNYCGLPSPIEIIHERIIVEAKRALIDSNKQVKLISHELGYTQVSTFSKAFKKQTGFSPTQFRAQQKRGK